MIEDELILKMQYDGTPASARKLQEWVQSFMDMRRRETFAGINTDCLEDTGFFCSLTHDGTTERLHAGDWVFRNLDNETFHVVRPEDLADLPSDDDDVDSGRIRC